MNRDSENERSNLSSGATLLTPETIVFDKFEIIEELGKGGMGVVLRVRDTNLDKQLALKVLNSQIKELNAVRRFQNEARNASRLSHYAVARIYDFGVSKYGEPFMAVELVEGETLDEYVRKNRCLKLDNFLTVFNDVLSGLDAAHGASIVHRDLKPGNIMVFTDEFKRKRAKLLDFGISKRVDISEEELGKLTVTGQIIGTPLYLSPEQANGEPATIQSDLYSLGCVMYFALTGKPPFKGDTAFDTLMMHREAEALPVAEAADGSALPPALTELIARLLSKSSNERPGTTAEVKKELRVCLEVVEPESNSDAGSNRNVWNERQNDRSSEEQKPQFLDGRSSNLAPILISTFVLVLCSLGGYLIISLPKSGSSLPTFHEDANLSGRNEVKSPNSFDGKDAKQNSDTATYVTNFIEKKKSVFEYENRDITDDDLKLFRGYRRLTDVNLSRCKKITSAGIIHLTDNREMVKLNASHTSVKSLAFVEKFRQLGTLELSSCPLGDSDLRELRSNGHIGLLDLRDTNVTAKGIESIANHDFILDESIVVRVLSSEISDGPRKDFADLVAVQDDASKSPRGLELAEVMQLLENDKVWRKLLLFKEYKMNTMAQQLFNEIATLSFGKQPDHQAAIRYFKTLKEAADRSGRSGLSVKRDCLYGIALTQLRINREADVLPWLKEASQVSRSVREKDDWKAYKNILWALYRMEVGSGKFREALLVDRDLAPLLLPDEHREFASLRYKLADYLKSNSLFKDASPLFEELIVECRRWKMPVQYGESLAGLAQCQKEFNKTDEALKNYLKAIEILRNESIVPREEGGLDEHARRMLAHSYYSAAAIQIQKGRLQEAVRINKEAIQFDTSHPDELYSKLLKQQRGELNGKSK